MSRPAIVATIPPITLGGRQPPFAEEAESEPRCACGLSTGTGVLNAGCPILFESAKVSAKEHHSKIDGHARTLRTLPRHHRRSIAKDVRSTAYVDIMRACTPWS
jgi:hypothetical protein